MFRIYATYNGFYNAVAYTDLMTLDELGEQLDTYGPLSSTEFLIYEG